jgi:hypothetical protein
MADGCAGSDLDAVGKTAVSFNDDQGCVFRNRRFQAKGSQSSQPHTHAQYLAWAKVAVTSGRLSKVIS